MNRQAWVWQRVSGVGKGTVLLEDFEKCDLVICIGHNPGTNHPRMLTSLRALVKRGAKMIAINPLQERGPGAIYRTAKPV
ncbi:putative molybdopterin-binding oxidoreductase [Escherichia coli]|uniref:Putative molybdopterin-binding oxidoreductase n=1 Tax=Escherichia coli TaxID=562 RepID=A0A377CUR4_ECOLX|nr:putative molybdopterin-binding oxidoreductase [Escherichia coli]